jgi:hypothetical protein
MSYEDLILNSRLYGWTWLLNLVPYTLSLVSFSQRCGYLQNGQALFVNALYIAAN